MNVTIEDEYLVGIIEGLRQKPRYPVNVERRFVVRINQIRAVENENYLRRIKSLHFEKLGGDRTGKYSIRVLDGWPIVFRMERGNVKVLVVEELTNHYKK